MGFKCTNDGTEFPTKQQLVNHMINVHNSPFLEGDEVLVQLSIETVKTKEPEKQAEFTKLFKEMGRVI